MVNIVRQGRSTLVAMIQMYKILALNSLISAYSLSVLHLAGVKQGDWQATIAGLLITVCFFGIAKSSVSCRLGYCFEVPNQRKAVEKLSKKRPQPNIFNCYIILSVLGQAAVHVTAMMYIRQEVLSIIEGTSEEVTPDSDFEPNLLNSAMYLVSLIMQVSTFAINYQVRVTPCLSRDHCSIFAGASIPRELIPEQVAIQFITWSDMHCVCSCI